MSYHLCNGIKFLKSLPDKSVDGIFTDPPWGGKMKIKGQKNYLKLISQMDAECERILRPGARVLVWIGVKNLSNILKAFSFLEYRWAIFCRYIPCRYIIKFQSQIDPILYLARPGDKYPWPEKSLPQLYDKVSSGKRDTSHPCPRPIEVVQQIIHDWFKKGEYIVDPFAGSDTVGFSCRNLDNPYDTCEIDPVMYKTGIKRNSQILMNDLLLRGKKK